MPCTRKPCWWRRRRRSRLSNDAGGSNGSAERLKQRGRISVAIGARLDERDHRLLIGLLRADERQVTHGAELELVPHDVQAPLPGVFGAGGRAQSVGIRIERMQRIGHVLKGGQYRRSIQRSRLIE